MLQKAVSQLQADAASMTQGRPVCASRRPLRVLQVIPSVSPVHGGPSKAIVQIESALQAAGAEVTHAHDRR